MPHDVILSPFEAPITYALFGITWLSCLFCIWVSIYFYRTKSEPWWLLVGFAFVVPLIFEATICLMHGLPPLPYALAYPEQKISSSYDPAKWHGPGNMTGSEGSVTMSFSRMQWSFYPPIMALALGWAYIADRKKRGNGLPTAET